MNDGQHWWQRWRPTNRRDWLGVGLLLVLALACSYALLVNVVRNADRAAALFLGTTPTIGPTPTVAVGQTPTRAISATPTGMPSPRPGRTTAPLPTVPPELVPPPVPPELELQTGTPATATPPPLPTALPSPTLPLVLPTVPLPLPTVPPPPDEPFATVPPVPAPATEAAPATALVPVVTAPTATSAPTAIPVPTFPAVPPPLPPVSFNNCQADANPTAAPNYPVRIVTVNKETEVFIVQNVSPDPVALDGWTMCSVNGGQRFNGLNVTLQSGEARGLVFPGAAIWLNKERDDGALYNAQGQLVSYWFDW